MSKIRVKITIQNEEVDTSYETTAILEENKIKYVEKNQTLVIYNYEENTLIRENDKLRMQYSFQEGKKTEGQIEIKEYQKTINLPIITKKIEKKDQEIEIKYQVENQDFLYKIEVEK